jgi:hypothetical protein
MEDSQKTAAIARVPIPGRDAGAGPCQRRLATGCMPPPLWEHGSVSNRVIGVTSVGSWGSHRALKRFHRSRAVDILMTRDAMPFSSQCFRPAVIV